MSGRHARLPARVTQTRVNKCHRRVSPCQPVSEVEDLNVLEALRTIVSKLLLEMEPDCLVPVSLFLSRFLLSSYYSYAFDSNRAYKCGPPASSFIKSQLLPPPDRSSYILYSCDKAKSTGGGFGCRD
nr:unnamed protein product [Spirometra erinaceieuropaei]